MKPVLKDTNYDLESTTRGTFCVDVVRDCVIFPLIITITISSNVIGASADLYLTNHPVQL